MNATIGPSTKRWGLEAKRYAAVGLLTLCIYLLVLIAAQNLVNLPLGYAGAVAYVAAMLVNYNLHHRWTYRSQRPHRSAMIRYLLLNAAFLAINALALAILPNLLSVHYLVVQLVVLGGIAGGTFALQRLWVFIR